MYQTCARALLWQRNHGLKQRSVQLANQISPLVEPKATLAWALQLATKKLKYVTELLNCRHRYRKKIL